MVTLSSHCQEQDIQLQNLVFLDGLFCEEEHFDDDDNNGVLGFGGGGLSFVDGVENESNYHKKTRTLLENDLLWEDEELVSLLCKEKEACFGDWEVDSDGFLLGARKEAVGWMLKVVSHYGFTPATAVLAVSYYNRFVLSSRFQRDKPWMNQLTAVACLSIAAKMEEIQVPLLLDLQVEDSKFVFEAKTIQRMELLVLSTLQWKMQLVTPLSFLDHIIRRFGMMTDLNWDFLKRCEGLILSVIPDARFVHYLPSVVATAVVLHAIRDFEPCRLMECEEQLTKALKVDQGKVSDCYKLIEEMVEVQGGKHYQALKRKLHQSIPGSPNGVIDAYFSSDSSNDSWDVAYLASPSKKLFKRSRASGQADDVVSSLNSNARECW
ncbi:OLC1v1010223C1 [Oldenlandia corymbosa var. corymbosa]|uniref:OLC1v1010223C1 n=1 Tax=Oldenlandia corymbosa var. corymbosa TaxID=529605 RepID=A0AAV1DTJ1_OLDCO|nr:OLC1v1010223C1 [Oldenlandia corymbosa var. corymbosa]